MRTITKTILFGAALACAIGVAPEAKADPKTHDGFYMSGNLGIGMLSASAEDGLGNEVEFGGVSIPAAFLLGGTVGPVVIGGGLAWHTVPSPTSKYNGTELPSDADVTLRMISFQMFADIYPDPTGGLHIQPMVGWGGLTAESDAGSSTNDPTGLILGLGVGYEFWVADQFSIGPLFRFDYGMFAVDDIDYPTIAPALLCSFTWH